MDKKYMETSLELASRGEGNVNPNPMVGAVVVKDGMIIGKGYHKEYGGPHAEVYALNEAGSECRGATIYVTLEPCSHHGKTPPCAEKIIEMGIKKCVIACLDPNPLVAGRGVKLLEKAGIEVEVGLMKKEALELNRVFMKYITTEKPFLFLKCAITLDGKIAARTGSSKWITNEISREKVQRLRHRFMGIMVGANTLIMDNPRLNVRIEGGNDPFRIVIDPKLIVSLDSNFVTMKDGKSIIVTSEKNKNSEKVSLLEAKGVRFAWLPGNEFKVNDILKKIGEFKIDSVLLEGGSYLISKAFGENEIDGGEIFIAPKILGDQEGIPFIKGFSFDSIEEAFELKNVKFNQYGNNISVEFYKD
ncbi:bifunctional diaminohydroxyphosphoribosylaminopyrimidine deaminase/5-amino-6-(5-phosphoribosylamino)uracil reductase RibD [uncultured Ilyobacter sp.]|uniref:bifunctional diaminohydroxyphosphoribosylaminopyrimidine deaminase/5-amino-6-(5-phosphoribosylamino)uracil reductase RibD n=1 Tax=uncultured Ilyobacter sp. TaxID=544433 RepID=UPI0029F55F2D|nr:bifunctional diaminohydroxyphosphoribosylaminopyrimidine deaminase/5-amino-6-(5-phosphoribosylamino)uracil reductase RibD [uncultured Ilyobacter sp.]